MLGILMAAKSVAAHVFETHDINTIPEDAHTFHFTKAQTYYYMHQRDSYLVKIWIMHVLRNKKVH